MNFKAIKNTLGLVLMFEAACMLLPLICAAVYKESDCVLIFALCCAICLGTGLLMQIKPPKKKRIYAKDGYVIVALSWIIMSLFGAIPFMLTKTTASFADALFETVSGFTTTGASILPDLDVVPRSILFWRSFSHWIGGMGVLVFLVALFPLSGGSNMHILKAESPGPAVSKLVPKIRSTAKILYTIYFAFTALEVVLLLLGGSPLFDALTLSFGTAGTGGFAILNSGLADYSSYIQIVITVFMIMFGIDFSLYYLVLCGKAKTAVKSEELRGYLAIIAAAIALIAFNCRGLFANAAEAIKHSAFQVASIITTTGYSTVDFDLWPQLSKTILVALMFVGACAGSTGGGMKVSRIIIAFKSIIKEIKVTAHPKVTYKICMNGRMVEHETVRAVNAYLVAYFFILVASVLIISIDNLDFTSNVTAVVSAMNNIGPGLSKVGPVRNFSVYSPLSTLVLTFDMLAGRLEIFPILVLFSPYTWKE